jgi:hypothetical protein
VSLLEQGLRQAHERERTARQQQQLNTQLYRQRTLEKHDSLKFSLPPNASSDPNTDQQGEMRPDLLRSAPGPGAQEPKVTFSLGNGWSQISDSISAEHVVRHLIRSNSPDSARKVGQLKALATPATPTILGHILSNTPPCLGASASHSLRKSMKLPLPVQHTITSTATSDGGATEAEDEHKERKETEEAASSGAGSSPSNLHGAMTKDTVEKIEFGRNRTRRGSILQDFSAKAFRTRAIHCTLIVGLLFHLRVTTLLVQTVYCVGGVLNVDKGITCYEGEHLPAAMFAW